MNKQTFKDEINKILVKKGYTIDCRLAWSDIEPHSFQDDAFICAAVVVYEELTE